MTQENFEREETRWGTDLKQPNSTVVPNEG